MHLSALWRREEKSRNAAICGCQSHVISRNTEQEDNEIQGEVLL